jgi:hypothetical protein
MFVSGIGGGSILLLCVLDLIAVLTVWLSICLLVVSVIKSNTHNSRIEPPPIPLTNI